MNRTSLLSCQVLASALRGTLSDMELCLSLSQNMSSRFAMHLPVDISKDPENHLKNRIGVATTQKSLQAIDDCLNSSIATTADHLSILNSYISTRTTLPVDHTLSLPRSRSTRPLNSTMADASAASTPPAATNYPLELILSPDSGEESN